MAAKCTSSILQRKEAYDKDYIEHIRDWAATLLNQYTRRHKSLKAASSKVHKNSLRENLSTDDGNYSNLIDRCSEVLGVTSTQNFSGIAFSPGLSFCEKIAGQSCKEQ